MLTEQVRRALYRGTLRIRASSSMLRVLTVVTAFVRIISDIILQKVLARQVPKLGQIGSEVAGLTALVTGATGGLGRASAIELGGRGASGVHAACCLALLCRAHHGKPLTLCSMPCAQQATPTASMHSSPLQHMRGRICSDLDRTGR